MGHGQGADHGFQEEEVLWGFWCLIVIINLSEA